MLKPYYSLVVPSKDLESIIPFIRYWGQSACACGQILIMWNGSNANLEALKSLPVIADNSDIIVVPCPKMDVYEMYNMGMKLANYEYVMLFNDDMVPSTSFDYNLSLYLQTYNIITFQLVEPGVVAVNDRNIKRDFGKNYFEFEFEEFDAFAEDYSDEKSPYVVGLGWYMPVVFSKTYMKEVGYYPTEKKFPYPNDIDLFSILDNPKSTFIRMETLVYHFQRLSQRSASPKPFSFNKEVKEAEFEPFPSEVDWESLSKKKLNLCCGEEKFDDCLNVDIVDSDLNIDLSQGKLPFPSNHFKEIIWKHGIEHFRFETAVSLLNEIHRVLDLDGFVTITTPELSLSCQDYLDGTNRFENCAPAINRLFGINSTHQVHQFGYTSILDRENNLFKILTNCGFPKIEQLTPKHRDEFILKAWKSYEDL